MRCIQKPYDFNQKFTNNGRFQVHENGSRNVSSGAGFAKKRVERIVATAQTFIRRHLTVRLNAVLQAIQFPTGVAHLYAGLADMNANNFTLKINIKFA